MESRGSCEEGMSAWAYELERMEIGYFVRPRRWRHRLRGRGGWSGGEGAWLVARRVCLCGERVNYHDGGEIIRRRSNKWRWRDDVEFSPSKITTTTTHSTPNTATITIYHYPSAHPRSHGESFPLQSTHISHALIRNSSSSRESLSPTSNNPVPCLRCVLETSKICTYEQ